MMTIQRQTIQIDIVFIFAHWSRLWRNILRIQRKEKFRLKIPIHNENNDNKIINNNTNILMFSIL